MSTLATVTASRSDYFVSYDGSASTTFKIKPADISDAVIADIKDADYTGEEVKPKLDVTFHLQQIYASYNQLESVASLIGLPELTYVDVDYNEKIEDIACLSPCYLLVQVNAFGTKVKEVKVLTDMGVIVNYDPTNTEE